MSSGVAAFAAGMMLIFSKSASAALLALASNPVAGFASITTSHSVVSVDKTAMTVTRFLPGYDKTRAVANNYVSTGDHNGRAFAAECARSGESH